MADNKGYLLNLLENLDYNTIWRALDTESYWVAVKSLSERCPELTKILINWLNDTVANRHYRIAAAEALGQIGDAKAINGLKRALYDIDIDVCRETLKALTMLENKDASEYVIDGLSHESPRVRENALRMLEAADSPDLFNVAIGALENKYACVAMTAAGILGRLGNTQAIEPLVAALQRDYTYDSIYRDFGESRYYEDTPEHLVNAIKMAISTLEN